MERMQAKKYYGALDGLRTIACFGVVMMHMKKDARDC